MDQRNKAIQDIIVFLVMALALFASQMPSHYMQTWRHQQTGST